MYWQKVPLSWREAPAAIALAKALHERDARVYLLDLWEWAAQHGSTHPSDIALHAFARAAFYDGDEQFFFDALRKTGWLSEVDGNVTILSWADVVASLHVANGLSADDIKRKQAAERAKRYRDRHAASRPVTQRHAPSRSRHADDRDAHRDAHRDEAHQAVTIQHETSTNDSVTQPSRSRHASRTEREKERDISTKNLALFAPAPSAAVEAKPKRAAKAKPEGDEPNVNEDRERWLSQVRTLTGLTESELVPSKAACIRFAQQRKARGMEQLMRALEGLQNDRFAKTAGLGYLLSDDGITKGLAKWKQEAGTTHVSRQYGEIDPELGF
jgi:hypothetical protein